MSSNDLPTQQTDAAVEPRATVIETSTPGQVVACVDGCEGTVSGLSRIEEPSEERPDVRPLVVPGLEQRIQGRFTSGNTAAWKHGLRSNRLPAEASTLLQDRITTIVADMGGTDALSAVALGQVKRHARLELAEDDLWTDLEAAGLSTGKGLTRARTTLWLAVVDRLQKSSQVLGLPRRSRDVGSMSIQQYLEHEQRQPPKE